MSNFTKEAQRKSVKKMLSRNLNPLEWVRYNFFEDYKEIYDTIRRVDKEMRNIALQNKPNAKEAIHQAKMAFKNHEYARVVYFAFKLIDIMDQAFTHLNAIKEIKDLIRRKMQREAVQLSDEERQELDRAFKKSKAELEQGYLISEANLRHWLDEKLPSYKGMKGNLMNKLFKNVTGKQREAAKSALDIAEKAFNSIEDVFDRLDSARTDPTSYVEIAENYKKKFDKQKADLSKIYNKHFSGSALPKSMSEPEEDSEPAKLSPADSQANVVTNKLPTQAPVAVHAPSAVQFPTTMRSPQTAPQVAPQAPQTAPQAPAVKEPEQLNLFPSAPPNTIPSPNFPGSAGETFMMPDKDVLKRPAEFVVYLSKKAEKAANEGHHGVAAALLVKASEICDQQNDEKMSIKFLETAYRILEHGQK